MKKNPCEEISMNEKINSLLISPKLSILAAMAVIENAPPHSGVAGIAIVVDAHNRLLGVVTDGDIRSAILHGISLEDEVSTIMTRDPISVDSQSSPIQMYKDVITLLKGRTRMLDRGAGKILVVDEEHHVVDIVSLLSLWQQSDIKSKKVAVLGMGFVGLTLAVVLADAGFQVLGIEAQRSVVEMLKNATPHFYEAGLANQLRAHVGRNLTIENNLVNGDNDIYIVSVGTPIDENHQPIMKFVEEACHDIGRVLKTGDTVMLRSTVPVGTTRTICLPILEQSSGLVAGREFSLVFAPERTIAGKALKELHALPQIIGALDSQGAEIAAAMYREITPTIVILESIEAAEMVKLVNNTFRDTIFAFANEVALVCDRYNLDANKIITAANEGYPRDPVPLPSPGVGGVCLKKDPYLLQVTAQTKDIQPAILGRSRSVNEYMPLHVFRKFSRFCEKHGRKLAGRRVFVVGFAFKGWPETSDMRDSATLDLVKYLDQAGVGISGYDPVVKTLHLDEIGMVHGTSLEDGFRNSDAVFIMNNHPSYEDWNLMALVETMNKPGLFVDGWSMFRMDDFAQIEGISYSSVSKDWWDEEPASSHA
jgi:UDP-N-acetyl-D-mannosaminuronic acid dehydrogenase